MVTNNKFSKTISFENHKIGLYDVKDFIGDWENKPRRGVKEKRCKIVKKNKDKVLEITIPKDTESNGGAFWRLNFPKNLTDVTFEYDIMFGKKFNFVRGGKLPGLAGGTAPGGGSKDKDGFSARLMWRAINFRDKHFQVKDPYRAYLVQYLYYPDKDTRKWGKDFEYRNKAGRIFVRGNKWYNIKMRIKLSQNPKKKDTILAWVNGKEVLNNKLNLRKKKSYGINQVMFSLFFGGNDETWHTKKEEKVFFRKFEVQGT